eukprot:CAMPEP_0194371326 /NCGR_PEP_ID=MMETSP0174-20130528/19726_1 /TAXON_ID=216777 /ORGANISM="Proboscia alata, Strain PI-D3" /LENGTH=510 /DNA_ID=CAMNT_0039149313 /DNA_START=250 /DNA_END=1782 /DNA_ORIENTATION=-
MKKSTGQMFTFHSITLFVFLVLACCHCCDAFQRSPLPSFIATQRIATSSQRRTNTELYVFDFFKKRAQEGIEQLGDLASATAQGKLGEGLQKAASYTQETNQAFAEGLAKSRTRLLYDLDNLINNGGEDVLEALEDVLLQADLGLQTTEDVMEEVKSLRYGMDKFFSGEDLRSILRGKLLEALDTQKFGGSNIRFNEDENGLTILFVMGANGMGKTTTIGKLANRLRVEGDQKVLLAACDTFRAAAVEQLESWGERAEVDVFSPASDKDSPSTVLYGALNKAQNENYNTLIIDTSGRLSNNDALNEELVKMKKVIFKKMGFEPHETILVVDAAQGRMALDSAKRWDELIGLTGLVLTKLDGSAKGGSVVSISRDLGLPVKLIGVGEGINDLRDFEADKFVDGLLGIGAAGGGYSNLSDKKSATKPLDGKLLANRLEEMRKERDDRAKTAAVVEAKQETMVLPAPSDDVFDNDEGIVPITGGGNNSERRGVGLTSKSKSNKKKKKKKKNKK